jgi:FkbM family methyltransferase
VRRLLRQRQWRSKARNADFVEYLLNNQLTARLPATSTYSEMVFVDELEKLERDLVCRLLRAGDFFIDIGANVGLYTLSVAPKVGTDGLIWAFEPTRSTHKALVGNLTANGLTQVVPFQIALSNEDGLAQLKTSHSGRDAWNTLGASLHGDSFELQEVRCARLDTLLSNMPTARRAALVKIDVEGWEQMVLDGMNHLVSEPCAPILVVELAPSYFDANHLSLPRLREQLLGVGYSFFFPTGQAGGLRPAYGSEFEGNVFAVKLGGPYADRCQALVYQS